MAADDGVPCYPFFEKDANLNSLRKDQRFITFMANLKRQWDLYDVTLIACMARCKANGYNLGSDV